MQDCPNIGEGVILRCSITSQFLTMPSDFYRRRRRGGVLGTLLTGLFLGSFPLASSLAGSDDDFSYELLDGGAVLTDYHGGASVVTIPSTLGGALVRGIGDMAFYQKPVTQVRIPETVTSIGFRAFAGSRLVTMDIPSSVTNVSYDAFEGCSSLTRVLIPGTVSEIQFAAFAACADLTEVNISEGILSIDPYAFIACGKLGSVTIPDTVTRVSFAAFAFCRGLTNIHIGAGMTNIEGRVLIPSDFEMPYREAMLEGCSSLPSLYFPKTVRSIGSGAFIGCDSLLSLYFEGDAPVVTGGLNLGRLATVFHRAGTKGWTDTFAGVPTAIWTPLASYGDWSQSSGLAARYPDASGENGDPDLDGMSNAQEWIAGTDPVDRESSLRIVSKADPEKLVAADMTPLPPGSRAIYFDSVAGRYYGIRESETVFGPWTLNAVRVAETNQTRVLIPEEAKTRFYRVSVETKR